MPFHDGGGLCSHGRWLSSCRTPLAAPAVALGAIIEKHLASIPDRKMRTAAVFQFPPFPTVMLGTARSELTGLLLPFTHRLGPHVPTTTECLQPFNLDDTPFDTPFDPQRKNYASTVGATKL